MSDRKPQGPDLDLIQRVQNARMQHDDEAKPSALSAVYWIEAKCKGTDCASPTSHAGQWVLNTTLERVDDLWAATKKATEAGQLGYKAKVSTASRSGLPGDSRTICVCAYDSTDSADVQRIRDKLTTLITDAEWQYETE